jgi:hypothetical protein
MGWKEVAYQIYEFFLEVVSNSSEVNAYYYSGKSDCKGIYWKDKETVLNICSEAVCKACGEKVKDHHLS